MDRGSSVFYFQPINCGENSGDRVAAGAAEWRLARQSGGWRGRVAAGAVLGHNGKRGTRFGSASLPAAANTPSRDVSDAPTEATLRTPTPAPGRAPSCQDFVAAATDVSATAPDDTEPAVDAPTRVRSPPPPAEHSVPFSAMVVDASQAPPPPTTAEAGLDPTTEGKSATDKGKGKQVAGDDGSPFLAAVGERRPSLFNTDLSHLAAVTNATEILSPIEGVTAALGHPNNPHAILEDDAPPHTRDDNDPDFQAEVARALAASLLPANAPTNATEGASTSRQQLMGDEAHTTEGDAPASYAAAAATSSSPTTKPMASKRKTQGTGSPPKRARNEQHAADGATAARTAERLAEGARNDEGDEMEEPHPRYMTDDNRPPKLFIASEPVGGWPVPTGIDRNVLLDSVHEDQLKIWKSLEAEGPTPLLTIAGGSTDSLAEARRLTSYISDLINLRT
ncbi:hypothetical protein K438DRAFT_1992549 [Mycena galopus ATCC 62051]|nr:hypothetical protein K438DRAFT_1992549 [Mycena galopus ATCC 62051]